MQVSTTVQLAHDLPAPFGPARSFAGWVTED